MDNFRKQILVPGILGGMGPYAHIIFEKTILAINSKYNNAVNDREHPVWLVISATNIPDRTKSLTEGNPLCLSLMIDYCQMLENMGADFIVIPCNTSHAFFDEVQSQIRIPILHFMQLTSKFISNSFPNSRRLGIIATDGTIQSKLYHNSLSDYGLLPIDLREEPIVQKTIMDIIYSNEWGVKATGDKASLKSVALLEEVIHHFVQKGCDKVIAGCTEISAILPLLDEDIRRLVVDPLEIIALNLIKYSYGEKSIEINVK